MIAKTKPRQTELHRHLDASLRTSTLLSLAQERGLEPQSTSLESFREKFILHRPLENLNAVLAKFELFQRVLDRPEVLERVGFEAIEDCHNEGTQRVELRFSPSFVCQYNRLSWIEVLDSFERGIQKGLNQYPEMQAGLICIATRDYGVDSVEETVEFFLKYQNRFIGLDLAGGERGGEQVYVSRMFENPFRKVIQAGAKITIHSGEDSGPENIWESIELLGAQRIGHGIRCIGDPTLLKTLVQRQICLEMCPTSNIITGCVKHLKDHPLKTVLRLGIPVCINTDDPGIFGNTLTYEKKLCREQIGLTEDEIELCDRYAERFSFLPPR